MRQSGERFGVVWRTLGAGGCGVTPAARIKDDGAGGNAIIAGGAKMRLWPGGCAARDARAAGRADVGGRRSDDGLAAA